jgi:penicillin-binding protein 2
MKEDINLSDILIDKYNEDDLIEVSLSDKVLKYVFSIITFILFLIFIKFFDVSILKHKFYETKAFFNVSSLNVEIAPRGIIYDAFQKPLIKNSPSFNVFVSYSLLPKDEEMKKAVLSDVARILNIEEEEIFKKIEEKNFYIKDKILLKSNISYDEFINLESKNIEAIEILPSYKREADHPFKFSHILGYVSLVNKEDLKKNENLYINDLIGRTGLEGYYDEYLRGKNGQKVYLKNASGKTEEQMLIKKAEAGNDLYTFIDKEFQDYFYSSLENALKRLERNSGFGIAMNPQNGEVLALFSIPSYEINNVGKYLNAPYQPLFNRSISGIYSPGSTIKPLVALAALKEGIITPDKKIFSPGYLDIPNPYNPQKPSRFLDWQYQGWVDMYEAIAKSSDVYFYEVGGGYGNQKGLGIYKLKEWWQKFLLDKETKIDLIGENKGFLPDPTWKKEAKKDIWRLGDTYNVSIGQGDLMITPIELLNHINAIANGGVLYKPRIVKSIVDKGGNVILETKPEILADLREEIKEYVPIIQKAMEDTVSKPYGTAYLLHDLPLKVAGKTGSAQVENNAKINAFFVGYAPADNPQIALIVGIENAREGSLNVVPVAKEVFLWYYENRLTKSN